MIYTLSEVESACFRKSLRITSTDFDDEISMLANQAIFDLISSGVKIDLTTGILYADPYIMSIILLYIKASFGLENHDQAWFTEQYNKKKVELLNKSAYTEDSDV